MFDLAELLVVLWAIVTSLRAKDPLAIVVMAVFTYLAALDVRVVLAGHVPETQGNVGADLGLLVAFMGPRLLPFREDVRWPLARFVGAHPAVTSVIGIAGLVVAIAYAMWRASKLRPEIDEARRLSNLTMPLVALAVMETVHVLATAFAWEMVDRASGF